MRVIPIVLAANFARQGENTPEWTVFLKLTRRGDSLVVASTTFPRDLVYGGVTYHARSGGTVSDVQTSAALSVTNSEVKLNFDLITDEDIQAKLWDGAAYELFIADYNDLPAARRYVNSAGNIGQITVDSISFVAELFGRMLSLQQAFGDLVSPSCTYTLGDPDTCKRDLTDLTVTGTAESVSADGTIWRDSARTEPGPSGGISLVSMTRGTTTTLTTSAPIGEDDGGTAILSDIDGPTLLAGACTVRNPIGNSFEIDVDTTDTGLYPNLISGTATAASAASGFFAFGQMRLDSGPNADKDIWREVKSYVEGEWELQDAFPFAVTGTEDYTLIAGCDKLETTCRVKLGNLDNFGGESKVPGTDRMVMVGRQDA